jgi:hypothetical protein
MNDEVTADDGHGPGLSFLLLEDDQQPDIDAIIAAAAEMNIVLKLSEPDAEDKDEPKEEPGPEIISFDFDGDCTLFVMVLSVPHPDVAQMPRGPLSPENYDALIAAPTHCIVTAMGVEGTPDEIDIKMAALTASVLAGVSAVGVLMMPGILFHRPDLFAESARDAVASNEVPMLICVDITSAQESDTHMSFLTYNMQRYGRENFYIIAPIDGSDALDYALSMISWMLSDRDYHLPTGDTVGRTAGEKIVVQRVPNPTGDGPEVIRLELPN